MTVRKPCFPRSDKVLRTHSRPCLVLANVVFEGLFLLALDDGDVDAGAQQIAGQTVDGHDGQVLVQSGVDKLVKNCNIRCNNYKSTTSFAD